MEYIDKPEECAGEDQGTKIRRCEPWQEECFGPETSLLAPLLEEFILQEARAVQYYKTLGERSSRAAHRLILRQMTEGKRRRQRRLAAALYLAKGEAYFPESDYLEVQVPPWPIAVRERYMTERAAAASHRKAAEDTCDPCLRELLLEMAKDEVECAKGLRKLLEEYF